MIMPGVSVEKACGHETPEKFCSGVGVCLILLVEVDQNHNSYECIPGYSRFNHSFAPNPQGRCMTVVCSSEHLLKLAPVDVVTPRRPRDAGGNVVFADFFWVGVGVCLILRVEVDQIHHSYECIPGCSRFNHSLGIKSTGKLYDSTVLA